MWLRMRGHLSGERDSSLLRLKKGNLGAHMPLKVLWFSACVCADAYPPGSMYDPDMI